MSEVPLKGRGRGGERWWCTEIESAVLLLIKEARDTIDSGVTGHPQRMLRVRDSISKDARFRNPVQGYLDHKKKKTHPPRTLP